MTPFDFGGLMAKYAGLPIMQSAANHLGPRPALAKPPVKPPLYPELVGWKGGPIPPMPAQPNPAAKPQPSVPPALEPLDNVNLGMGGLGPHVGRGVK